MRAIEEFYIGYLPTAPPKIRRRVKRLSLLLLLGAVGVAVVLTMSHRRLPAASFEWGVETRVAGTIQERPVPMILVDRPGGGSSSYLLVDLGKFGAADFVSGWHGRRAELLGTLIYREGRTMLEVVPGSLVEASGGAGLEAGAVLPEERLGRTTVRGEIVDSKCFLGVMNPGSRKPHRACAVRCISGGIPPMLRTGGGEGMPMDILLVGQDGESIGGEVLPFVAEPVVIEGDLVRMGELYIMYVRPDDIRRVG